MFPSPISRDPTSRPRLLFHPSSPHRSLRVLYRGGESARWRTREGGWIEVELTRRGILATVAVFVVVAVCVRLGVWQLDRRDQRLERNAAIAERMEAAPVPLTALPDTVGLTHRRVRMEGRYDHDRSIILGARSHRGAPGVYVFTPLHLGAGAVLVNRGFLPSPDAATIDLATVSRPPGAAVEGVLLPFPDVPVSGGGEGFQTRWFRLDGPSIRAQYPYDLASLYLLETAGSHRGAGGEAVAPTPLDPPALDAGPHLSYAVQWFSFATIFLVGWVVLMVRKRGGQTESAG
jgi:surfeit locus 1 family protein